MEKRRVIGVIVGLVLCLGALAAAQSQPLTTRADKVTKGPTQTTLAGNVVLTVNGVVVRADRAVIQNGEVTLEGNVRMTLPKGINAAAAVPPSPPVIVTRPFRVETQRDIPLAPAWQPPPRSQRPLPAQ